jgi:hypothetical protein
VFAPELRGTRLIGIIESGDCGSWVLDPANGDLLGIICGACPGLSEAYIIPAKSVIADIGSKGGFGTVELPVPSRIKDLNSWERIWLPNTLHEIRMHDVSQKELEEEARIQHWFTQELSKNMKENSRYLHVAVLFINWSSEIDRSGPDFEVHILKLIGRPKFLS